MPIDLEIDQFINAESGELVEINGSDATVYGILVTGEHGFDQDGESLLLDKPRLMLTTSDAELITDNSTVFSVGGTQYQSYERSRPQFGLVTLFVTRDF